MKHLWIICNLLLISLIVTGCASEKTAPTEVPIPTQAALPSETSVNEFSATTASEYLAEINPEDPLIFRAYVLPNEERLTVIVLHCGTKEYPIFTPSNGVNTFNHCFLNTVSDSAAIVLPDGSTVFISPHSSVQVNLSETENRLFLKKGEVLSYISNSGQRKFTIYAGDKAIQIPDGTVAVRQSDNVLTVATHYFITDPVSIQRCSAWQNNECQKWETTITSLSADEAVIGTIGSDDWQHLSGQEENLWYDNNAVDLPFSPTILESYFPDTGVVAGAASTDLTPYFENAQAGMQDYFVSQFMAMGIDGNDYNQMIYKGNFDPSVTTYCTDFPESCESPEELAAPEWAEALDPGDETDPGSSGGSPSGKFPEFDRSTCFSRDGHAWCFPYPDSVDITMSAEWDLTAICMQYPGEAFCAWSEVQNTLP